MNSFLLSLYGMILTDFRIKFSFGMETASGKANARGTVLFPF